MLKASKYKNKLVRAIILSVALHCILIIILFWNSIQQLQEKIDSTSSSMNEVMLYSVGDIQQYNRHTYVEQKKQVQEEEAMVEKKKAAAEVAAKKKAAAEVAAKKKAAAEVVKQSIEVDDLLDSLANENNRVKFASASGKNGPNQQSVYSSTEFNAYKAMLIWSISKKFYDVSSFVGKTCNLQIKLAPDGRLIAVREVGGDPVLCQAAISAAKLAMIPEPPSMQLYEIFKDAILEFSPR